MTMIKLNLVWFNLYTDLKLREIGP